METEDIDLASRSLTLHGLKKLVSPKFLFNALSNELSHLEGVHYAKAVGVDIHARLVFDSVMSAQTALERAWLKNPSNIWTNWHSFRPVNIPTETDTTTDASTSLASPSPCHSSISAFPSPTASRCSTPSPSVPFSECKDSTIPNDIGILVYRSLKHEHRNIKAPSSSSTYLPTQYSFYSDDSNDSSDTTLSSCNASVPPTSVSHSNDYDVFESKPVSQSPPAASPTATIARAHDPRNTHANLKRSIPAWEAILDQLEEEEKAEKEKESVGEPEAEIEGFEDEDFENEDFEDPWGYSLEELGFNAEEEDGDSDEADPEFKEASDESHLIYRFDDHYSLDGTYVTDDYDGENDFFHPYAVPTPPMTNCIPSLLIRPTPNFINLIDLGALAGGPSPGKDMQGSKREHPEDSEGPRKKTRGG